MTRQLSKLILRLLDRLGLTGDQLPLERDDARNVLLWRAGALLAIFAGVLAVVLALGVLGTVATTQAVSK